MRQGITMGIAGWLWADLLLGAFVIFAVANTGGPGAGERPVATPASSPSAAPTAAAISGPAASAATPATPTPPGVDPVHLEVTIPVNGAALLSGDAAAVAAEQERVLVAATLAAGSRRVALVFAYGSHQDAATGDRLAALATARLRTGPFDGALVSSFHNIVAGDRGSSVVLSLYFYR